MKRSRIIQAVILIIVLFISFWLFGGDDASGAPAPTISAS